MLFDSTLRRELARNFGATLVVILTIVLTMMLIRTLGQAAGGRVAPQDVVLLLGYVVRRDLADRGLADRADQHHRQHDGEDDHEGLSLIHI